MRSIWGRGLRRRFRWNIALNIVEGDHFDVVIIGAGMSGLAAGIRLVLFGKKVLILERHNAIGGLNSFYSIGGRKYDVGLHAMTNYAIDIKGSPLMKIFRQLRIHPDEFDLSPQRRSKIVYNGASLFFDNNINYLRSEIEREFPEELDGFNRLCEVVEREFGVLSIDGWNVSAFQRLGQYIKNPILRNLIILPPLFYGSAWENDMGWNQFVVLFKSIFLEGLARPYEGIRVVLRVLKEKYKSLGGLRKMKCGVKEIRVVGERVRNLILDDGVSIMADHVISSIGLPETLGLCSGGDLMGNEDGMVGKISFVETALVIKDQPRALGWDDTIIFYNDGENLNYECPKDLVGLNAGVICIPNNYVYRDGRDLEEGVIRVTALGNYDLWSGLNEEDYRREKGVWFNRLQEKALKFLPSADLDYLRSITVAKDMFTPRTIKKYTGHLKGAVYGASRKSYGGRTHLENLYICGTDEGFLGVTGAMISGIGVANRCVLAGG